VLQFSLGTRTLKEAKRKREIADIEWSARFAAAENRSGTTAQGAGTGAAPGLSNASLTRLVWDYVERMDERFRARVAGDPPENEAQKAAITTDVEIGLQTSRTETIPAPKSGSTARVSGSCEAADFLPTTWVIGTPGSPSSFAARSWSSIDGGAHILPMNTATPASIGSMP
jgi:hypothetical protein